MTARRFKLVFEDDGSVFQCAAFDSETAREQALGAAQDASPNLPDAVSYRSLNVGDEPRPIGRPSFNNMLAAALKAVGSELVRYKNITDRARHVSRHLARSYAAEDMPGMSTVRNYLAEHAVAKNPAKNPAKNSTRAKIAS